MNNAKPLNSLALADAMSHLGRHTDGTIPLHTLVVLLVVAGKGKAGTTLREVEAYVPQVPPSSLHRALQRLGDGASEAVTNVGEGLGLIERYPDPVEGRRFRYQLTAKGKSVLADAGIV